MRKILHAMKFRTKLALAMMMIIIVPMSAFCLFYVRTSAEKQRDELLIAYDAQATRGVNALRELMGINTQKFSSLDRNAQLQMFLKYPQNVDLGSRVDLFYNLNSLYQALCISSQLKDMRIYSSNLQDVSLSFIRAYSGMDAGAKALVEQGIPSGVVTRYEGSAAQRLDGLGTLSLYKANVGLDGRMIALQEFVLDFSMVTQLFGEESYPPDSALLYCIAGENAILLHGDSSSTAVQAIFAHNGGDVPGYVLMRYDTGLRSAEQAVANDTVMVYIPQAYLNAALLRLSLLSAAGIAIAAAVVVFVVAVVSRTLTRRLYNLINNINVEEVNLENGTKAAILGGDDEFQQINLSFHRLIERIKESYQRMANMEAQKKLIEAELMQELINPHFLYNTLEGVRWAAADRRLADIVGSVIQYYRIALNKGNAILKVSQELRLVEEYMKLQRFAYESQFRWVIECEESLMERRMLKHLLQPIVENSILHGIDKRDSAGLIVITGERRQDSLIFIIRDNGAGMDEGKLTALRNSLEGDEGSFGLRNVQRRLRLNYGGQASLAIESAPGQGTVVTLTLPLLADAPM